MNSARASRSAERRNMLSTTAARTNHGAGAPMPAAATPAMKKAGQPSSVNARAAARHTETYEISVLDARTTGIRDGVGNFAIKPLCFAVRWAPPPAHTTARLRLAALVTGPRLLGEQPSGAYQLKQYYLQRASNRDFRAATTERPGITSEETLH